MAQVSKINIGGIDYDIRDKVLEQEVAKIQPIVNQGTINNAADEEDLTSENSLLKLKDRTAVNGMGYIILRKNKTFAEQVTQENTIYEIRYAFDLDAASVTIPAGCVLVFNGGSLTNGTLSGTFNVESNNVCFYNVDFTSAAIETLSLAWFNIRENVPCTNILNVFFGIQSKQTIIPKYGFELLVEAPTTPNEQGAYSCVEINKSNSVIDFNSNTIRLVANGNERYSIIDVIGSNLVIKNLKIYGDVRTHTVQTGEQGHGIYISQGHDIVIQNCESNECWGDGIDLADSNIHNVDYYPYNIIIKDTKCLCNRRQGISIEAGRNIHIMGCDFAYTGQISATAPTAGVNIEPWHTEDRSKVMNIYFEDCSIHDNLGTREFMISGQHSTIENISLVGCHIYNTLGTYKRLFDNSAGKNIRFHDCVIGSEEYNGLVKSYNCDEFDLSNTKIYGQLYLTIATQVTIDGCSIFRNDASTAAEYSSVTKLIELWSCNHVSARDSKFRTIVDGCFYIHESTASFEGCEFSDSNPTTKTADRLMVNASIVSMKSCNLSLGTAVMFLATPSQTHHFSMKDSTWEKKPIGEGCFFYVGLNSRIVDYDYDIEIKDTILKTEKGLVFSRGAASDSVKIYIERFPDVAIIPDYNDYRLLPTNDDNNDYTIKHSGTTEMRGYVANHLNKYQVGFFFFDTTLSKPCWWNGTGWKDATGATV